MRPACRDVGDPSEFGREGSPRSPARRWSLISAGGSVAASGAASGPERPNAAKPAERRVFLLGLRQRGKPGELARQVSDPASPSYRRFLSNREYRKRFSAASPTDRRRVRRFSPPEPGVKKVQVSSDRSVVPRGPDPVAPASGSSAPRDSAPPTKGLCTPAPLRGRAPDLGRRDLPARRRSSRGASAGPRPAPAAAPRTAAPRRPPPAPSPRTSSRPRTGSTPCTRAGSTGAGSVS